MLKTRRVAVLSEKCQLTKTFEIMNRRKFIQTAALAAAATSTINLAATEKSEKGVDWTIGCFNRPWVDIKAGHTIEMALDGIKAAGFRNVGLLTPFKGTPLTDTGATAESLASLKKGMADRDLKCIMASLHSNPGMGLDEAIKQMRGKIDNAKAVEAEYLLTFGVDDAKDYPTYCKVMTDAAAYSQERGMKLVIKPHGGSSGSAEEIIKCIGDVGHPNFKIWYDAGNIIYYTGKDPVEQLKPIVEHVTGLCAKDCAGQKGEIWMEFGTGKVNFPGVFALLKQAGFNGPVMVECCAKGNSVDETTAGAKRNREILEKWFAEV